MKLMPRAKHISTIERAVGSSTCAPNVIVPRASGETVSAVPPSGRCSMGLPLLLHELAQIANALQGPGFFFGGTFFDRRFRRRPQLQDDVGVAAEAGDAGQELRNVEDARAGGAAFDEESFLMR